MTTSGSTKRRSKGSAPRRTVAAKPSVSLLTALLRLCPLLLLSTACLADWPVERGDAGSTGAADGALPEEPALLWKYEPVDSAFETTPVVANGVAYLGDFDGTVHAIRVADGSVVWTNRFEETGFLAAGAIVDGDLVIGDDRGIVRRLSAAEGSVVWQADAESEVRAGPMPHAAVVLVTTEAGRLVALDAKTGAERWRFEIDAPLRCTPTIVAGCALLAGCDGDLHAIDLARGEEIGKVGIGGPTGNTVALLGDAAYFGTEGGEFLAVDASDPRAPKVAWEFRDPRRSQGVRSAAAATEGAVVFGNQGKAIYRLDSATGERVWQARTRSRVESSPVIVGDRIVAATGRGRLLLLDVADGATVWEYDAGGSFVGSPAVADGRLLIANTDGVVYCFGAPVNGDR